MLLQDRPVDFSDHTWPRRRSFPPPLRLWRPAASKASTFPWRLSRWEETVPGLGEIIALSEVRAKPSRSMLRQHLPERPARWSDAGKPRQPETTFHALVNAGMAEEYAYLGDRYGKSPRFSG